MADLITIAKFKSLMNITDELNDSHFTALIPVASDAILKRTGQAWTEATIPEPMKYVVAWFVHDMDKKIGKGLIASESTASGSSTTYIDKEVPDHVQKIIDMYTLKPPQFGESPVDEEDLPQSIVDQDKTL